MIKENGAKAGAVLNPATPLSSLDHILEDLDLVLIMSVNPGFGGQKFIPGSLEKISLLKNRIRDRKASALIEVDGGVGRENAAKLVAHGADVLVAGSSVFGAPDPVDASAAQEAGADVFVAGSAIFNSGDYRQAIDTLRSKIGG